MHQYRNRRLARPRKSIFQESDCQAGCGVLPFRYREDQFVNALQWAIGLELFLLVKNPWQIFLTTDHPNGAPFTAYPHLIKLLCSYDFRMEILDQLHPAVKDWSNLADLKREYTLEEIAIVTRSGPANSLGVSNQFNPRFGSAANLTLFQKDTDIEKMFSEAALVVKDGSIVWQDGRPAEKPCSKTIYTCPLGDRYSLPKFFQQHWSRYNEIPIESFAIGNEELMDQGIQLSSK
jgi:formylmethanofuran dehydrogenase subunit A